MDFPGLDFAAGGYWAAFLPDMKRAVIAGRRSEGLFGLLVDLETGKTRPVTPPLKCCNAQLSPDGRFLAAEPLGGGWTSYPLEDGLPASLPGVKDGETVIGWTPGGLLVSPDAERRWGFPRADSTVHIVQVRTENGTRRPFTTLLPGNTPEPNRNIESILASADGETVAYSYSEVRTRLYLFNFKSDASQTAEPR